MSTKKLREKRRKQKQIKILSTIAAIFVTLAVVKVNNGKLKMLIKEISNDITKDQILVESTDDATNTLASSVSASQADKVKVAAGNNHFIALKSDGTAYTWGLNNCGQLGTGDTTNRLTMTPVKINGEVATDIIDVAASTNHTVLLRKDGTVWAAGDNSYVLLGTKESGDKKEFTQVADSNDTTEYLQNIIAIATSEYNSYALTSNGEVYAWGENWRGQIGDGTIVNTSYKPSKVQGISNVIQITSGESGLEMLKSDGTVWGIGYNGYGQLGTGNTTNQTKLTQVLTAENTPITNAKHINTSNCATMITTQDNSLYVTGYSYSNSLFGASPTDKNDNLTLAEINPEILLKGDNPRLIDEWQVAPKLWDAIRYEIDHRNSEGLFILTGSSTPANMEDVTHTGTGRFAWMTMRPMSLYESGDSNGQVSLKDLFDGKKKIEGENKLDIERIAYLVCRGGWPRTLFMDEDIALDQAFDYYDAIVYRDINKADGVTRNPERAKNLMRSYSRNIGTQAATETIKNDMIANDSNSLSTDTVLSYINALKMIFVIEESPAWNPNLRSKTAIRTSETRYFVDPSIAVAALGVGPKDLMNDLNTFGLLFETLCIRDLRVYADSLQGEVYHYRDASELECDAVIHLRNGSYGLIEIKIGGDSLINEGAENLKKLESHLDTTKMKKPSFLMVLTATGKYAYKREDGVYVIPIGCLKN